MDLCQFPVYRTYISPPVDRIFRRPDRVFSPGVRDRWAGYPVPTVGSSGRRAPAGGRPAARARAVGLGVRIGVDAGDVATHPARCLSRSLIKPVIGRGFEPVKLSKAFWALVASLH